MKKIVLMYHDVINKDYSESGFQNPTALKYKVFTDEFEAHISGICDYLHTQNLPLETVRFTFDDGGSSFLTVIAPLLEKYNLKGTFFIATRYIGTPGFLSNTQIIELANSGHIIGAHSHSHPERLSALSLPEIVAEWTQSQVILKELLGYQPTVASIPNGYSSTAVINAMIDAGITEIYTSTPTTTIKKYNNSHIIGRFAITRDYSNSDVLKIITSPYYRIKQKIRNDIISVAKIVLGPLYLSLRKHLIHHEF